MFNRLTGAKMQGINDAFEAIEEQAAILKNIELEVYKLSKKLDDEDGMELNQLFKDTVEHVCEAYKAAKVIG